ncbi:hypothetical protein V7138_07265 [Bacillus sp. JJ1533]|uniref:hypothetical protein n=1 Tax=Bacillus sp. JJ1533 TaxID=3122959 RepID=UPI002FFDD593
MFWYIATTIFVLYVIYSLSTIKYQLRLISKHLNVKEEQMKKVSNDEIEKQLEEDLKRK